MGTMEDVPRKWVRGLELVLHQINKEFTKLVITEQVEQEVSIDNISHSLHDALKIVGKEISVRKKPIWYHVCEFISEALSKVAEYYRLASTLPTKAGEEPPDLVSLKDHMTVHSAVEFLVCWGIAPYLVDKGIWLFDGDSKKWSLIRNIGSTFKINRNALVWPIKEIINTTCSDISHQLRGLCEKSTLTVFNIITVSTFEMFLLAKFLPDALAGSIALGMQLEESEVINEDEILQRNKEVWMTKYSVGLLLSSLLRTMRVQQQLANAERAQVGRVFRKSVGFHLSCVLQRDGGLLALFGEMLSNVPEGNVGAYTKVCNLICSPPSHVSPQEHFPTITKQIVPLYKKLFANSGSETSPATSLPNKQRMRRTLSMLLNTLSVRMPQNDFHAQLSSKLFSSLYCFTWKLQRNALHQAQRQPPTGTNALKGTQLETEVELVLAVVRDSPATPQLLELLEPFLTSVFVLLTIGKLNHGSWRSTCQELLISSLNQMPREISCRFLIGLLAEPCKACFRAKIMVHDAKNSKVSWELSNCVTCLVPRSEGAWNDMEFTFQEDNVNYSEQEGEPEETELLLPQKLPTARPRIELLKQSPKGLFDISAKEEDLGHDGALDEDGKDVWMDNIWGLSSQWSSGKPGNLVMLFCTLLNSLVDFLAFQLDGTVRRSAPSLTDLQENIAFMALVWQAGDLSQAVQDGGLLEDLISSTASLLSVIGSRLNIARSAPLVEEAKESPLAVSTKLMVSLELVSTVVGIAAATVDVLNTQTMDLSARGNEHVESKNRQLSAKLLLPLGALSAVPSSEASCLQVAEVVGLSDPEAVRDTLVSASQVAMTVRMALLSQGESLAASPIAPLPSPEDDVIDPVGRRIQELVRGVRAVEPPARAMAVDGLRDLLEGKLAAGDGVGLLEPHVRLSRQQSAAVVEVLVKLLYDLDPYVFLTVIRALSVASDRNTDVVLPRLVDVFCGNDGAFQGPQHAAAQLRIGEVLMLTVRRAGEMLPKYIPVLVPALVQGASVRARVAAPPPQFDPVTGVMRSSAAEKQEGRAWTAADRSKSATKTSQAGTHEPVHGQSANQSDAEGPAKYMLRSSCLAILAYVCSVAPRATLGLATELLDLGKGVLSIERTALVGDEEAQDQVAFVVDTRRAAAFMLEEMVLGWKELHENTGDSTLSESPSLVQEMYRLLKVHSDGGLEADPVVLGHCATGLMHLDVLMRRFLFPERKKELKVSLGIERL